MLKIFFIEHIVNLFNGCVAGQKIAPDVVVAELGRGRLAEDEIPDEFKPKLKIINKKPIEASEKELKENSRSKSAKLRIVERV